ncbi:MAG TPA: hypothetical protein VFQ44_00890 [Streptosporangiaceae bacterium]|nr:hypothetical protein [Streptosporangiaceae bacterium]
MRTVLNPAVPLFREARYLLAEEAGIREPALYNSVLADIAAGNATRGGIANFVGRKSAELVHPLNVLEDTGLVTREADPFHGRRSVFRITEPLITFYEAVMRNMWGQLEQRQAANVWRRQQATFASQVTGPHFESLCRAWAAEAGEEVFGDLPAAVSAGAVTDPGRRRKSRWPRPSSARAFPASMCRRSMTSPHLASPGKARAGVVGEQVPKRLARQHLAVYSLDLMRQRVEV